MCSTQFGRHSTLLHMAPMMFAIWISEMSSHYRQMMSLARDGVSSPSSGFVSPSGLLANIQCWIQIVLCVSWESCARSFLCSCHFRSCNKCRLRLLDVCCENFRWSDRLASAPKITQFTQRSEAWHDWIVHVALGQRRYHPAFYWWLMCVTKQVVRQHTLQLSFWSHQWNIQRCGDIHACVLFCLFRVLRRLIDSCHFSFFWVRQLSNQSEVYVTLGIQRPR